MICNSITKKNFKAVSLIDFRAKYVHIYKCVGPVRVVNRAGILGSGSGSGRVRA